MQDDDIAQRTFDAHDAECEMSPVSEFCGCEMRARILDVSYAIPPLTDAEAFRRIRDGRYHRIEGWCTDGSIWSGSLECGCLEFFLAVLDGHPGDHDQPFLPPKTWEEMTEAERNLADGIKAWSKRLLDDNAKRVQFDLLAWGARK